MEIEKPKTLSPDWSGSQMILDHIESKIDRGEQTPEDLRLLIAVCHGLLDYWNTTKED